jgi:glycosyltransferase involved in cell wall biosynthesis
MSLAPKCSVVVPCLDHAQFIRWTIDSVMSQEDTSVEVIVIDGGSTDGTQQILQEYGGDIQWESRQDRGVFEALNRGFEMARGDIVGWLNSDDVFYSVDVLREVTRAFERNPDTDIVYGDAAIIGEDNRLLRLRLVPDYDRRRLERTNMIVQPAVFLRRHVVKSEKLRPFLSLDYEYWIRLGRKGYSFRHLPALLAADRQYPSRVSVHRHQAILKEMVTYKAELGVDPHTARILPIWDHYRKAPLRLRGVLLLLKLMLFPSRRARVAFPMWVDSPLRLLTRQILRHVTEVGV